MFRKKSDRSTGKSQKLTITNDKGRLSKDEIERMVVGARKHKAEEWPNKSSAEKLVTLQASVRSGGKGLVRRKSKTVRKTGRAAPAPPPPPPAALPKASPRSSSLLNQIRVWIFC